MDNLRFSTLWEPVFPFRQMYISAADRVGMYELRTAGTSSPALPVALGLRSNRVLLRNNREPSNGFVWSGRSARQYGLLLRRSSARSGFLIALSSRILSQNKNIHKIKQNFSMCASSYLLGRRQSPCGNRKCPDGTFSRKAVTGLSGQGPNGEWIYRKFPVFVSKSYITFSDKTKSSLYRLLFSVRVELSSRAVASQVLSP